MPFAGGVKAQDGLCGKQEADPDGAVEQDQEKDERAFQQANHPSRAFQALNGKAMWKAAHEAANDWPAHGGGGQKPDGQNEGGEDLGEGDAPNPCKKAVRPVEDDKGNAGDMGERTEAVWPDVSAG